jgi:uncharacterized protein (DUF697 family)
MARAASNSDKPQSAEVEVTAEADAAEMTPEQKADKAERIIKDHILLSGAAGFVPSPGFDLVAGYGVQLAMLARLSKLYGVPYSKNIAKGTIVPLLTSVGGIGAARILGASAVKVIPIVGSLLGAVSMPVTMGALTYGLGKVFAEHFSQGGTFLDFNAKSWGPYFKNAFNRGKDVASELKAKTKDVTAPATAA